MSLTAIRPYFRARLDSLSYVEWTDGFNFENIPSNILDGSYHLESGQASGIKQNQDDLELSQVLTARLFIKGYRDPASAIDSGHEKGEAIIKECLKATLRLTSSIKNITFTNMDIEPVALSNDNAVIVRMEFNIFTIIHPT